MLKIVGAANDLSQIAGLLDVRRRSLGLTCLALDDAAGLSSGYSTKLFAKGYNKNFGNMSLSSMLGALGGLIFLVCDDDLIPPITNHYRSSTPRRFAHPPALLPHPSLVAVPIPGLKAPGEEAPALPEVIALPYLPG
ncbi:MAG: hypothetical protein EKK29_05220 [Hyphomicrobiales bacterium]|nr:MAG: hypothetical protein EKK29_05220 [Hyphomicrobiales bacterium]